MYFSSLQSYPSALQRIKFPSISVGCQCRAEWHMWGAGEVDEQTVHCIFASWFIVQSSLGRSPPHVAPVHNSALQFVHWLLDLCKAEQWWSPSFPFWLSPVCSPAILSTTGLEADPDHSDDQCHLPTLLPECQMSQCLAKQISCSIKLVVFIKFKCVLSGRDFFSSPRWRTKYDQNVNYLQNLLCIQSSSSSSMMRIINIFTSSSLCESMGGFLPMVQTTLAAAY